MQELLFRVDFEDVCDLEEGLHDIITVADAERKDPDEYPVILIEDANGTQLNCAKLYSDTLTDGSKVYKIVLDWTTPKHLGR